MIVEWLNYKNNLLSWSFFFMGWSLNNVLKFINVLLDILKLGHIHWVLFWTRLFMRSIFYMLLWLISSLLFASLLLICLLNQLGFFEFFLFIYCFLLQLFSFAFLCFNLFFDLELNLCFLYPFLFISFLEALLY